MPLLSVPATQNSSSNKTSEMLVRNKLRYYADAWNSVSNDGGYLVGPNDYVRNIVKGKYIKNDNNYRGTFYNGASWVDNGNQSYWNFDGTNDFWEMNGSDAGSDWDWTKTDDDGGKMQYTMELWLYPTRNNSADYWMGRYDRYSNAGKQFIWGQYGSQMRYVWWQTTNGGYQTFATSYNVITINEWQHFAVTVTNDDQTGSSPRKIRQYRNCVQVHSYDANSGNTNTSGGGSRLCYVGTPYWTSWCYKGRMAQMRLYHRRLSLNELKRNFNRDCVKFGLSQV